jgi:hypothetical protein
MLTLLRHLLITLLIVNLLFWPGLVDQLESPRRSPSRLLLADLLTVTNSTSSNNSTLTKNNSTLTNSLSTNSFTLSASQAGQAPQASPSPLSASLPPLSPNLAAERLAALPELKTKLLAKDKFTDLTIIITPALLNKLLQTLHGQTFKFQDFLTLTIQNGYTQLYNGLTLARLQAELATNNALLTVKQTLDITARLVISATTNEQLLAKLQVVTITAVVSNPTTPSLTPTPEATPSETTLPPEALTALLPSLQLPLTLDFNQSVQFEAIKQQKPLAFEARPEARQLMGKFEITALLPLENRLVLRAQIRDFQIKRAPATTTPPSTPTKASPINTKGAARSQNIFSTIVFQANSASTLDSEINQLTTNLTSKKDLSLRLERRFLARLMAAYARASTQDLLVKLLPARLFSSQSDLGFARYENYLDIETGQGTLDLRDADLELLENGRGQCLVDLTGQFQGQARGRQLGINYTANPQVSLSLKEQFSFQLENTAQGYQLSPVNKPITVHLNLAVPVPQLGTSLKLNRDVVLQTSNLLRPLPLPTIYATGLQLLDNRSLTLTDLDYFADQDQLWLGANLKIN